ncbi:hypothetical protein PK28_01045 [Hymenobacter sp. DG25B]|uniref:UbiA family prenyltransferase n=1 Tax=Hymenobacter sp. DG25B TaxID=1385664 RepID=UPI0005411460|nr:UbiA family prenyltransferase [Hymenobacter sp. DG25B]AIZ62617.1 hypothetical protein PK28_01045 [Hymenobacter sp. DG25B]
MMQLQEKSVPRQRQSVVAVARADEWWAYKFSPLLATFYASACVAGVAIWPLLGHLLLLLLALTIGAIYVSLLNDWTDRADDLAGGKHNRLAGRSALFIRLVLFGCIGIGVLFGWYFWQLSKLSSLLYLGAWLAYTLYSLPPVRLKTKGLAGVLADASGAHLFPQLLTVSLLHDWAARPLPGLWWLAVGAWALACGFRNILWHQLTDVVADEQAGVATLVTVRGAGIVKKLGERGAFPIEIGALGLMLWVSGQGLPLVLLALYGALELFRFRLWNIRPVVLEPHRRIILNEFYEVFYPLSFLLLQCWRFPTDGLVLGLHLLLFWRHLWPTLREVGWAVLLMGRKTGKVLRQAVG